MSASPTFPVEVVRDIEAELSEPLFRGVPIGPTLNDICVIGLYNGRGDWSLAERWKNRLRRAKHFLRPQTARQPLSSPPGSRILVTWIRNTPHFNGLVFPVLEELGPERSILLCADTAMLSQRPAGFDALSLEQVMRYDVSAWRADYRRCRPEWHRRVVALCRDHRLPSGVYDSLALTMMIASQRVAGWLEGLPLLRPAAIVVEYDRNGHWSCLVLAARQTRNSDLHHGTRRLERAGRGLYAGSGRQDPMLGGDATPAVDRRWRTSGGDHRCRMPAPDAGVDGDTGRSQDEARFGGR